MKWHEQRDLLLAKAADDQKAMTVLMADTDTADTAIGFHAQQAVEKCLKALLCHVHVSYRKTHDLVELMDQLADAGHPLPAELDRCKHLQPYAVQLRYDNIPVGSPPTLDRAQVVGDVRRLRDWVAQTISGTPA